MREYTKVTAAAIVVLVLGVVSVWLLTTVRHDPEPVPSWPHSTVMPEDMDRR